MFLYNISIIKLELISRAGLRYILLIYIFKKVLWEHLYNRVYFRERERESILGAAKFDFSNAPFVLEPYKQLL